jgi:tetratricopeptide (TPR) repeat protein
MTSPEAQPPRDLQPFEERIEILARELELATRWHRPCILLVVYGSEYVRADVQRALGNFLIDLGQKTATLKIRNKASDDMIRFLQEFREAADTVFFIEGLRRGNDRRASVYTDLNLQREFLLEKQVRVIFWLTHNEIVDLARHAPDFWTCRHRVIEFVESPQAERVLQGALESAWQGLGEYADPAEDTDAKISLRETLLTELPSGDEASSTRANLLLTLGILNWRKGDYEKADELLGEALRIATRVQDGWFEAECFNAIALVKTSLERIDEAINAYKQAIQLAPDQIFAWNNLGNLCARIGRNDEAIVVFQKAIECNPRDPIGWNGLGNVYSKIGYTDDAIGAFRKSIKFMPTFAHPWNGLGEVYERVGRVDEAISAYCRAIELNRNYVAPWLRLGALFNRQGRRHESLKAYQQALDLDPHNAAIWNEMGTIHLNAEDFAPAARAFERAIQMDRSYGWAYSNLALTHARQGANQEAVALYVRSIELLQNDKDRAISWNRLADVYRQLDDYDNAIAAYRTADLLGGSPRPLHAAEPAGTGAPLVRAAPPSANRAEPVSAEKVLEELAAEPREQAPSGMVEPESESADAPYWIFNPDSNTHVGLTEPAAETPEPMGVVMQHPTDMLNAKTMPNPRPQREAGAADDSLNPLVWNEKGNIHFRQQEFDQAASAYNRAIQLDARFGWPYCNLALTYLIQGQYAEAILLYQKSIELLRTDRDRAISWNGLGNVYRYINDYHNAVAAYQKAAELDPQTAGMRDGADSFQSDPQSQSTDLWNELGELFFKTGAYHEALAAFRKAVDLEPVSGLAHSNLARTLAAQGQYAEAIPLYEKGIRLLQSDKDKAVAWNLLGDVYRKVNDYDKAMHAYQQAVGLADEGSTVLNRARFSLLSNCDVHE